MASHTTFTDLPQEILDVIVDHYDDTAFLRACSLANSKLRPRAQSNLFENIYLPSSERVHTLLEIVKQNPRIATYIFHIIFVTTFEHVIRDHGFDLPFLTLVAFIIASSPPGRLAMRLYISGTRGVDYLHGAFEDISAQQKQCFAAVTELTLTNLPKFPLSLLRKFTNAPYVVLENASIESGPHFADLVRMDRHLLPDEVHPIQHLIVNGGDPIKDIPLSLISRCRALDKLELMNVTLHPSDADKDRMIDSYRPMLNEFCFSECDLPTIQALGNFVVDFSNLKMVSNTEDCIHRRQDKLLVEDAHYINHVMRSCGRSLQTLSLFCTAGEYPMPPQTIYDLHLVPRLRCLTLFGPCHTDEHMAYTPYYMFSLLRTIDAQQSNIQKLTFHFEIETDGYGNEVNPMETIELPMVFKQPVWAGIKAALAQLIAHHEIYIQLTVTVLVTEGDKISPDVSETLCGVLEDWACENLDEYAQTYAKIIEM